MKVIFKTNIDAYQTNCWPTNLEIPPRIGEKVSIAEVFCSYFINKKLPTRLEVVDVIWTEMGIVCELYYDKEYKKKFKYVYNRLKINYSKN